MASRSLYYVIIIFSIEFWLGILDPALWDIKGYIIHICCVALLFVYSCTISVDSLSCIVWNRFFLPPAKNRKKRLKFPVDLLRHPCLMSSPNLLNEWPCDDDFCKFSIAITHNFDFCCLYVTKDSNKSIKLIYIMIVWFSRRTLR